MPGWSFSVGNRFFQSGFELREVGVPGNTTHAGLGLQECQGHPPMSLRRVVPPLHLVDALGNLAHEILDAVRGLEVASQLLEEAQAVQRQRFLEPLSK